MKNLLFLLLSMTVISTTHATRASEIQVDVLALFKDAAMLDISGNRVLLKTGEVSPEGIALVSANSRELVIEHEGQRRTLNLSGKIGASFTTPENISVSILLNRRGQYRTSGTINGHSVNLLIDTGANIVAINAKTAASLYIDLSNSRVTQVETAGGMVSSHVVMLDSVSVGGIKVRNVKAVVVDGIYPVDILLGMSFLENVDIKESSGIMQLIGKF